MSTEQPPRIPLSYATPTVAKPHADHPALAVLNALGAYLIWGVVGWYFQIVTGYVEPFTLLAHRAVWSLAFVLLIVCIRGEHLQFLDVLTRRRVISGLAVSSLLIGINWTTFIYAAHVHKLVEASLGYFLSPLMNVVLGVALLGERLRRPQIGAIVMAAVGVGVLCYQKAGTIWIPIVLMLSWSFYVLMRKRIQVSAIIGLGVETAILTPLAIAYLIYVHGVQRATIPQTGLILTILAGGITAIPLMMFAYAARRLTMATLGIFQYVGPTVQFLVASVILGEHVSPVVLAGFGFIWLGLIVFTVDGLKAFRQRSLAAAAPPDVSSAS